MIRWIFGITFIVINSVSTLSAKPANIEEVKKNLGAGINISLYEHYWKTVNEIYKEDISTKIKNIHEAGCKTIRLPVAFDLFLQPNSSNLQPEILNKLKEIYTTCNDYKMNLIITYHYGKLNADNTYSEIDRISWIWKQVQNEFKGIGYDNLLFELYNEPTLSPEQWKQTATKLVQYVRYEDANRIYIVGGNNYNSLDALKDLGKLPDDKILYTFHFYEPFIFTHQGAEWTDHKTYITGLPYPYKKHKMPELPMDANGTSVEQDYNKYSHEATKEYLISRVKIVTEECRKNNMPLICTETGVIVGVKEKYRKNYLADITSILQENNIETVLWDYDQKFSVSNSSGGLMKCLKSWIKHSK
jgi:hypothetical protein